MRGFTIERPFRLQENYSVSHVFLVRIGTQMFVYLILRAQRFRQRFRNCLFLKMNNVLENFYGKHVR